MQRRDQALTPNTMACHTRPRQSFLPTEPLCALGGQQRASRPSTAPAADRTPARCPRRRSVVCPLRLRPAARLPLRHPDGTQPPTPLPHPMADRLFHVTAANGPLAAPIRSSSPSTCPRLPQPMWYGTAPCSRSPGFRSPPRMLLMPLPGHRHTALSTLSASNERA